jgi:hypothetical protein
VAITTAVQPARFSRFKRLFLESFPGADLYMTHNAILESYEIYATVQYEREVLRAEKWMGELLKDIANGQPVREMRVTKIYVASREEPGGYSGPTSEEEKAARLRALVAALWPGGSNSG